ncbi:MAG: ATP-binding cassette domain-containing protein [Chloroflexi bacterium]|nr:ATP-binding cassette domain-containing protein [Chloroflexota bacterium]
MPIIETGGLVCRYGSFTAVDSLSLSVEPGELFGLLGPNGAGKSTVIKTLTTLLRPTRGTAAVAGFDVVRQAASVRRSIGYVPQLVSADQSLTGYENLWVFARLYDVPRREREQRIEYSLAFMGLEEVAGRLVRTYSGGMIRRLEIAQSILHHPRVLFLDEPTIGLDPLARKAVWDHIRELRDKFGMTILMTTHLMDEADSLCGRVAIMHHGKMVALGSPAELKAAIGGNGSTLEDVFVHYTGDQLAEGGTYRDVSRTRRNAKRLG